jgi:hypothetical protein
VSAGGHCTFRYYLKTTEVSAQPGIDGRHIHGDIVWRKADFRMNVEERKALSDAVHAANVFDLRDLYNNPRVADGTQWVVRLRAEGRVKRVKCDNQFPARLRQMSVAVRKAVIEPHRMEVLTATRDIGEFDNPDKLPWLDD